MHSQSVHINSSYLQPAKTPDADLSPGWPSDAADWPSKLRPPRIKPPRGNFAHTRYWQYTRPL